MTRRFEPHNLEPAAQALRDGALIAFPTETVYGLGANALDPAAVARLFEAKGRPSDNPLIVHIADLNMLDLVVSASPAIAQPLIATHWPGPLTLLFPKSDAIPASVTAGLPTVAVRMPSDPIARELIRRAGVPLVAPSANRSGRPSATTWNAVADDLDGRIDGIVCGEPTRIGLESTVLDLVHDPPRVLRHGAVSLQSLQQIAPQIVDACSASFANTDAPAPSPGMKHRHYQPRAQVRICLDPNTDASGSGSLPPPDPSTARPDLGDDAAPRGWIGLQTPRSASRYARIVVCDSIEDYAAKLFQTFRDMDHAGIGVIDCQAVAPRGLGRAIMDRLERASSHPNETGSA